MELFDLIFNGWFEYLYCVGGVCVVIFKIIILLVGMWRFWI